MSQGWTSCLAVAFALMASLAPAAHTEVYMDDSPDEFSQGDLTTSTLTWDGFLRPPLRRERLGEVDGAEVVWDLARFQEENYLATGHEGKLFRQTIDGGIELVHEFEESALYSLVPVKDNLLVAASPGGKIYTLVDGEKPEEFSATGAKLVWDMVESRGDVYAATGTKASIVRINSQGTTSTLAQLPQALNILDLEAVPGSPDLVFASQGPGLMGRVTPEGDVSILMDTGQEEVRRVGVLPDGSVIGAVNGTRSPGEELLKRAPGGKPGGGNGKPRPASFIVRAYPDGFAEEWWTSPESPIHDIYTMPDGSVLVSAGSSGRLFEVTPEGRSNRAGLAQEDFVTRLAPAGNGELLVGTGSVAALYRMDAGAYEPGIYESRVFDAKGTVSWGRLRGYIDRGDGKVLLSTRTGNTGEPDDTWSEWSEPIRFDDGQAVPGSAVSRFFQYRLDLEVGNSGGDELPSVNVVRVFFTRPNSAPSVSEVSVSAAGKSNGGGSNGAPSLPEERVMAQPNTVPAQMEATWKAEDPDGDILLFDLSIRQLGDRDWVLVEEEHPAPKFTLQTQAMPDGEYRFRVEASDGATNAPDKARTASSESALFLVDNTAPELEVVNTDRRTEEEVVVTVRAEDSASLISGVAWRANMGNFHVVLPMDDALDESTETFRFTVEGKDARRGSFLSVSATDELGNTVIERLRLD